MLEHVMICFHVILNEIIQLVFMFAKAGFTWANKQQFENTTMHWHTGFTGISNIDLVTDHPINQLEMNSLGLLF